jgi:hypothetical protein
MSLGIYKNIRCGGCNQYVVEPDFVWIITRRKLFLYAHGLGWAQLTETDQLELKPKKIGFLFD